jgi:hypothetical protein
MSTGSPPVGQVSPDGLYRWDGQQWVALASGYREPTSWTRPLQLATAGYLVLSIVVSLITSALFINATSVERAVRAQNPSMASDQIQTAVSVGVAFAWAFVIVLAVVSLVVAIGSFLGWRWMFWVALVWLGLSSLGVITNLNSLANTRTQVQPVWSSAVAELLSLVALGLFIWLLVSVVRYGPWAMRKPGV